MVGRFVVPLLYLSTSLASSPAWGQPAPVGGAPPGYYTSPSVIPTGHGGHWLPAERPREVYEELADDPGFFFADTPLERGLKNTFRHGFFRAEFLSFDIQDPPDGYVGAPSSLYSTSSTTGSLANLNGLNPVGNPRTPVANLRQPITGTTTIGSGTPAFYDNIDLSSINGVRGTYGFPLAAGMIELSAFAIEPNSSTFSTQTIPQPTSLTDELNESLSTSGFRGFVVTPVRTQNTVGGDYLLYDRSYRYDYRTTMYGVEANFIGDEPNPNLAFRMQPLFGFRYVNFRESFNQSGSYFVQRGAILDDGSIEADLIATRRIFTEADNYQYGPQLGFRAEANSRWFCIGIEPKAMIGLNSYKTFLSSSNVTPLLSPATGAALSYPTELQQAPQDDSSTEFGAILDFKTYARLNLSEQFGLYVSYNAIFMPAVTRPYDNVNYNITTDENTQQRAALGLKAEFTQIFIQAVSVGGELRY